MDPQHGPKLGLVLGGVLERFWKGFWKPGCAKEAPRRRQDGHDGIVFGIDFLMDVACDLGWVSRGVLGASWGVLGSSWGRLGTSWGVLGASSLVCAAILEVLDGLDGLLTSFESMMARCLGMLRLSSRFEGFRRVSAERFPRCASTASRE